MKTIDAHCIVGNSANICIRPEELLESMEKNNIEKSIICPEDRWAAVYNEEGNRFIAEAISKYQGRFYCFAAVNPWYGKKAAQNLEDCLAIGFNGVYFHPIVQGFMINDEMIYPLIDLCEKYSVPVYFHTGTPMQALPFQVLYLARCYPKVNFMIGHMGANDYLGDAYAAVELADNIYLETSLALTVSMRAAAKKYADRMIFGSNAPRSLQEFELSKIRDAVADQEALEKILAKNMSRILGGKK